MLIYVNMLMLFYKDTASCAIKSTFDAKQLVTCFNRKKKDNSVTNVSLVSIINYYCIRKREKHTPRVEGPFLPLGFLSTAGAAASVRGLCCVAWLGLVS